MAITGMLQLGGGIATANKLAFDAFINRRVAVDIVSFNEKSDAKPLYEAIDNVQYVAAEGSKFTFISTVWRWILGRSYDYIFCDHVNLASMLVPLRFVRQKPFIVRLNGIEVFPESITQRGKLGLRAGNLNLSISNFTKTRVEQSFPNINVVNCDLSLDSTVSIDEVSSTSSGQPLDLKAIDDTIQTLGTQTVLHVGRMSKLEQYKGQDNLIRAMPTILEQVPAAQLVLVGKGDDAERLRDIALEQPAAVQQAIFMTGYVSDEMLTQLYQQCYMFAMPGRGEGFGLVYLEAMQFAKPCIGSRIDASQTIVQHTETGLLVENPLDVDEIATKVIELLKSPSVAAEMGQAGFERLKAYYLFPHFEQRFWEAIDREAV